MLSRTFNNQVIEILREHPSLEFNHREGILKGTINIDKIYFDFYDIIIDLNSFPKRFPDVWEVGERIPRKMDRHIYTDTNSCCFTTRAKEQILLRKHIKTVPEFFTKILIPYFLNNSYFEVTGKYMHGEYAHDVLGIIEAYQDIVNTTNLNILIDIMVKRIKKYKFRVNELCFCDNGKKIKKCHLWNFYDLCLIDNEVVKHDLNKIFTFLKK